MAEDVLVAADPVTAADRVTEAFARRYGRPPAGCFRAPGRVNLIGEHLDYNGGLVLPIALRHSAYAAVAARDDDVVQVTSLQQPEPFRGRLDALGPGAVTGWPAYAAGVVWALREQGLRPPGLDVLVDSEVPVGSGLSSSAALECSVALAAAYLEGAQDDRDLRQRLVAAAIRAETEVAGAPTGGMDQTISLFGRAEHALLLDCRDGSTRQLPWQPADATLLVVDTRASHSLNDGGYQARRHDCESAAAVLGVDLLCQVPDPAAALEKLQDERVRRRARHVLTELARVSAAVGQIEAGDFTGLGETFTASHASLRDDFEVSCAELDAVVDAALAHGALGARMTGGGFGGSAIALVPEGRLDEVRDAVRAAFAANQWPGPVFLDGTAGGGAERVG
jgi:galactokinase